MLVTSEPSLQLLIEDFESFLLITSRKTLKKDITKNVVKKCVFLTLESPLHLLSLSFPPFKMGFSNCNFEKKKKSRAGEDQNTQKKIEMPC